MTKIEELGSLATDTFQQENTLNILGNPRVVNKSKTQNKQNKLIVNIDEKTHETLKILSKIDQRSMNAMVNYIIQEHLLKAETLDKIKKYKELYGV